MSRGQTKQVDERPISTHHAARRLGVDPRTIRRMIADGRLEAGRKGRNGPYLILPSAIARYLDRHGRCSRSAL
jgi:excisionase family DNA binding protein